MRGWLRSHPQATVKYDSSNNLSYDGGISGVGVTTGTEKVYLVFWGSQWGTQSTNGSGYQQFTGDAQGIAPDLQAFFSGLGTGGETWSGVMTQYCEGVSVGTQDCPPSAAHVGYPTGGALAGVWEDTSGASPSSSTGHQLAVEAEAAATHFANATTASNRNAQYVIVSPTGTNPDDYQGGGFCAWHDYSGDATLDGGGGASGPLLAFTNLPYITDAGANCGAGFVNSPGTLDGVTIVEGHEYAETITDQFPAGGWTDNVGQETGDKCAWISSGQGAAQDISLTTGSFAVQSTWANDFNGGAGDCEVSHSIVSDTVTVATTVEDAGTSAAWSGSETTGAAAYDTASVTGSAGPTPTGSVTYDLYGNGSCAGSPTAAATKTVSSGGSVPNSPTSSALAAGSYSYQGSYSGDSNYGAKTGSCEAFSVAGATPSLATTVDDAGTNATWGGNEAAGATSYDTAKVNGVAGFAPSGSVTYDLYLNASCAGSAASTATRTLNSGGTVPNSPTTSALAVGSYSYQAAYSGDSNYTAKKGSCEAFAVGKAQNHVTITSTAPAKPAVGGKYTPTATATAGTSVTISLDATSKGCALATGVVTFFATGTCVIDFNNPGTSTYLKAGQIQQALVVGKGAVKMTASATPTPSTSSRSVDLKVKLSSTLAAGTVKFYLGMTTLCTATVESGKGSCKVTKTLSAGTYKVTARYAGNSLFVAARATTSFKVT
jgi:hypothetical protein